MRPISFVFILLLAGMAITFSGCAGMKTMSLNSVQLTSQLKPGMTYEEVEGVLGKPRSTRVENDKFIARWNLQEMWRGYIPYDMVFSGPDRKLISWAENTEAFKQQQAQMQVIADEMNKTVAEQTPQTGGNSAAAPAFESDPALMKYFAGAYFSFSAVGGGQTGGTERKISLCPDGKYYSSSESGYSGSGWGTASQGGGGGTWRITGTKTSGTIVTTSASGQSTTYKYEVCGDGCIYFGNNKFAYAGAPQCR